MSIKVRVFSLPKEGNDRDEYEDASAFDEACKRLALADGASDAFEARLWACALTESFVKEPPIFTRDSILAWLALPIESWNAGIQWDKLPWYAEEKARRGSFATLLGIKFSGSDQGDGDGNEESWNALALGDSCLFHCREKVVVASFPVTKADEFGTTPWLLSTKREYSERSLYGLKVETGKWKTGDLIVLCTDAFAAWLLDRKEDTNNFCCGLGELSQEDFESLVKQARHSREMKNDDVTVMTVCNKLSDYI